MKKLEKRIISGIIVFFICFTNIISVHAEGVLNGATVDKKQAEEVEDAVEKEQTEEAETVVESAQPAEAVIEPKQEEEAEAAVEKDKPEKADADKNQLEELEVNIESEQADAEAPESEVSEIIEEPTVKKTATSEERPNAGEHHVTDALSLAEALGGDASWVNGNVVTLPENYNTKCRMGRICIDAGETVLDLNGQWLWILEGRYYTEEEWNNMELNHKGYYTGNLEINDGSLTVQNGTIWGSIISNGGKVSFSDVKVKKGEEYSQNVIINGGNASISNSIIAVPTKIKGGELSLSDSEFTQSVTVDGGTVIARGCEFCTATFEKAYKKSDLYAALTINDGTVLLEGTEKFKRISTRSDCALVYRGGELKLGEDTLLIAPEMEYDAQHPLPIGRMIFGQGFIVKKSSCEFLSEPEIEYKAEWWGDGYAKVEVMNPYFGSGNYTTMIVAAPVREGFSNPESVLDEKGNLRLIGNNTKFSNDMNFSELVCTSGQIRIVQSF